MEENGRCRRRMEEDRRGGGVGFYIRENIDFKRRCDLDVNTSFMESIFIEVIRGGGKRNEVVGAVYRPPGGDLASFSQDMVQIMNKVGSLNGYIMGDFNIDLLSNRQGGSLPDFLGECMSGGFYPLISLPSRLTDTTATLIDNIWTNNVESRMESGLV